MKINEGIAPFRYSDKGIVINEAIEMAVYDIKTGEKLMILEDVQTTVDEDHMEGKWGKYDGKYLDELWEKMLNDEEKSVTFEGKVDDFYWNIGVNKVEGDKDCKIL